MFKGHHTFNEFLNAGDGIASNVRSQRLERLVQAGILRSAPTRMMGAGMSMI
jgi:DNA-binding HxlR family transcriptional regulator